MKELGVVLIARPCSRCITEPPLFLCAARCHLSCKSIALGEGLTRYDLVRTKNRQTTSRTWINRAAIVNKL
jgi:hypothetical protein